MELLVIDTGFQARNSNLQDSKSNWTSLFRIVPASDVDGLFLQNEMIDEDGKQYVAEKNPTKEEFELFVNNLPELLREYLNEGHIPDATFD
jgi:hypothetical protein